jgi:hypothetical protein
MSEFEKEYRRWFAQFFRRFATATRAVAHDLVEHGASALGIVTYARTH